MSCRRSPSHRGFTLVELLVVIGIIAVLIAILLPALRSARRQAAMVQCQSNMKQIAMAIIMYADANKGKLPPATVSDNAASDLAFPNGWWWPNELVRYNFIKAPSLYERPGVPTSSKRFSKSNVFRCPEGIEEEFLGGPVNGQGLYPTHMLNNGYTYINDTAAARDGIGIPSWYMLNTRGVINTSATQATNTVSPAATKAGTRIPPFISFLSAATIAQMNDPAFSRSMNKVRKGAELIMLVEAANNNWYDQGDAYPWLPRLGARHGKKTGDGLNAWTNFAFFDGHVSLYPSADFQGPNKDMPDRFYQGTIFYLNKQQR